MSAMASLVSLGSVCPCASPTSKFDGSYSLFRRVSYSRNFRTFPGIWVGKRWKYVAVCRYSVATTEYIPDQGTSVSLDSTFRASNNNGNDADLVLKPAPKPQLQSGPTRPDRVSGMGSLGLNGSKSSSGSDDKGSKTVVEEKSKIIESLGEVLEKAERLENSKEVSVSINRSTVNRVVRSDSRPVNLPTGSVKKAKTMKSVWRKGNPVSSVQKVVEVPKQQPKSGDLGKVESKAVAPLGPPHPALQVQPTLQAKPSSTPPVVKRPVILKDGKRPVILKDVGAASKPAPVAESSATKERKPILIDKFASKKSAVDPLVHQAVLGRPKPLKGRAPGKPKDGKSKEEMSRNDFRRKASKRLGNAISDDDDDSIPGAGTARKGRKWTKASRKAARIQAAIDAAPVQVEILEVGEEGMKVEELAYNLAIGEGEIFGTLYSKGIKPDGVQKLSRDLVKMICQEYDVEVIDGITIKMEEMAKKKEIIDEDDLDSLEDRPPVLTIMGHVDHGKTTLLDYIRKTKVAAAEAGGITQGIGAYKVQVPIDGKTQTCVFLDTPGHEAFGAMRARGARVTDIAVIVVAADDGIRPQTKEAIAHARAAGVPIVIAINKIDKEGASSDRVMQELSSIGLMPEDWGGDTPIVKISALRGENVDDLLETIMLVAELQELKANPQRNAKGTVIEAGLDKAKGPIATFIVQNGTLRKGDVVICGEAFGKVRALFDDLGKPVDVAGPSTPVQVIGLSNVPLAGDEFEVVESLDLAREKASLRAESLRNERLLEKAGDGMITLSSLASAVSSGRQTGLDLHQLNVILKVDLQGSIEAVREALRVLPQDNVTLKFLLQATGDVSTSDVDLASASQAIIFGFNVKVPGSVKSYAKQKEVEIRVYKIIYELIDEVRNEMESRLDPVEEKIPVGTAEVRAVFKSGSGQAAGCMVTEGKVVKDCGIRVVRGKREVFVGILSSLQRVKELVKEVNAGLECGIGASEFSDWAEGDIIEVFRTVTRKRTLEEASASMAAAVEKVGPKF